MKKIYDFTLEVPAPKVALDAMNEIVNRHAQRVDGDELIPKPSPDDETEIMTTLFG
jgi:hypothetical protein